MPKIFLKKEPSLVSRHAAFGYQKEAVNSIRDLEYAAIFHEQGLGKSKIAIDLMLYWLESKIVDTVLLVAKKSLIQNWERELKAHTYMRPIIITQNHRANYYAFNSPSRLMLTHFEVVASERERMRLFLKARDVGVIIDESAKMKNPDTDITKALFELSTLFKRRIIMTGTPVANRPYDIWAQVWFLDQGRSLGDNFSEFRNNLDLSNDLSKDEELRACFEMQLEQIYRRIAPFSVRETKKSGIIKLPEKSIQSILTDWENLQYEMYCEVRDNLRLVIVREGLPTEDRSDSILKRLLRLVQVASNPQLVDPSYSGEPGKLPYLLDLVEGICKAKEKCIVWTSFTENVDWLAKVLNRFGTCRVHGGLAIEDRNRSIDKFMNDPTCRIMIATPGAAKEGLTLTVANHVIFYDRNFSLDDYLQAQDRIHRISQTKQCFVHNFLMRNSIDEWVDILLSSKQLAAQLAQGDISNEYYRNQISYEFGDILKDVLGIKRSEEEQ